MAAPLYTPRVNNNDDTVRLTQFFVEPGAAIKSGDPVADVETDKATFTVEADRDGYLLAFSFAKGETIAVGSVLAWIGDSADEALPSAAHASASRDAGVEQEAPTLKAAILLATYGLSAREVPAASGRLSATDVENYVAARGLRNTRSSAVRTPVRPVEAAPPPMPGRKAELSRQAHGMLRTVAWHKSEAVPGYLELEWDPEPWNAYAEAYRIEHKLLLSPLLPLLAWRLAQTAAVKPQLNSTVFGEHYWQYEHVNVGFTVQSGPNLIVVVAPEAEKLDQQAFVNKLSELQRGAMRNALSPEQTSGATIGFSSMARWPVTRHVPVLLPHTAIMIAHTAPVGDAARIGATYDHRVLHGADVVDALRALTLPPVAGDA
jgi:pyruvate dehydrogenase E2 component (dihydrolipoamide acetyltransferase)